MPDQQEIARSIYGAWLLARMDRSGMAHFNISFEGFWRSFFAAVIVAPGYAILVADKLAAREETFDLGWVFLVQTVAYAIGWAAFPLVAIGITALLNLSQNYVPMIIAANWAAVVQVAVFLGALLLTFVLPGVLAGLLLTAATIAILFYQWFVLRTALDTTGGIALALVLVDLLLNAAINLSAEGMI